ncbi:MAG TPA: hypothetical protein VGE57_09485 [Solimonas sp.]
MNATASKAVSVQTLETYVSELCRHWGPGFTLAPAAHGASPHSLALRTPDQGLIAISLHGHDLEFRASGWPQVNESGFKRSYHQELSANVSITRGTDVVARDLERRLLVPYAAALTQARRQAAAYRSLIADVAACLDHVGFGNADRHVLGRSLQAQKPHGALDDNGRRLPTTSVTTITARDDSAAGNVEVRGLSLPEVEALHGFIGELIARRKPVLRLAS